ncbi:hypothetical protein Tco_1166296 [Tanacetum coccineum]
MVPPNNLCPDLAGKPVNETSYKGMIGSLMYLTAIRYLKGTLTLGLYYLKCLGFDLKGYLDLDYASYNMDRKSTSAKAEYVAAAGCCASIIWMKSQLINYDIHYKMVPIFCDNTSAIVISNNPVLHSRTKHIDIRYHFIRDHILKGDIELHFIPTEYQLADIFTKPLDEPTFTKLKAKLGMEFWSTVVAYDPFPSTDETEQCPLREFLIKFLVLNGQRPLTLDFNTFCSSTGLDYNNGKYVSHPTPEAIKKELGKIAINPSYLDKTPVLKNFFTMAWRILFTFVIQVLDRNYSSTKQVNFIQQLLAYSLNTRTEGPVIPGALSKKSKRPKSKKPPTETKVTPPKQTEGSDQSHSVSSGTVPDPQDLERNIQLAITGLPYTLDEDTRKSKPLPDSAATHPKDSGGNIQPLDRDIPFTTSDEGTTKTTPNPEGSFGDKDPGETCHPLIWNHYTPCKPSHKGEMDTQPIVLSTYADVRAFMLSNVESDEDILGAGEEMDEEPQVARIAETHHQSPPPQADKPQSSHAPSTEASDTDSSCDDILKKYDNTLPLTERQLVMYLRKVSNALFTKITEDNWQKHEEAAVNYAYLRTSIDDYYDENIAHRDQTDKLVEASMSSIDKRSNTISNLYKGLNIIIKLLKEIKNAVKDYSVINKKITKATESFTKFSTNITDLQSSVNTLQAHALKQDEELAA